MGSNLKKCYEKYYDGESVLTLTSANNTLVISNPFYMVEEFLNKYYVNCKKNYHSNLKDLKVIKNASRHYIFDYDNVTNTISSKDFLGDIYGLLHIASVDRENDKNGIINNGVGYGLNAGICEFYASTIVNVKNRYPIESLVAEFINRIDINILGESYFGNKPLNLSDGLISNIDKYHDNYINLSNLYNELFYQGMALNGSIYGKLFRGNSFDLTSMEYRIDKLENDNFALVYNIISELVKMIYNSNLTEQEKAKDLVDLNRELNRIYDNAHFHYLRELIDVVKDSSEVKKLILNGR